MTTHAIIAGNNRCGTTTCYYGLAGHPQIFAPRQKEINFFLRDSAGNLPTWCVEHDLRVPADYHAYRALFVKARPDQVTLDGSPNYFRDHSTAVRIYNEEPCAHIILVLRQPVDQVFSVWKVQEEAQPLSTLNRFITELETSSTLPWFGYHGLHLSNYLKVFSRKQIHVGFYDTLTADPDTFFREIFDFLGVDSNHQVKPLHVNRSGAPTVALYRLLTRSERTKHLARSILPRALLHKTLNAYHSIRNINTQNNGLKLPAELRAELTERFYRDDIRLLEDQLGCNLSHWLSGEQW
jgi:hypothetical protein